jgi:hypothetical protein
MAVLDATRRAVWVAAGGRCCICKQRLDVGLADAVVLAGDVAHIAGSSASVRSPRGDSAVPLPERDREENLLLLCPGEHRMVDGRLEETFTEDVLLKLKMRHEKDVQRALDNAFGEVRTLILRIQGDVAGQPTNVPKKRAVSAVLSQGLVPVSANYYDGSGPFVVLPSVSDPRTYREAVRDLLNKQVAQARTAFESEEFDVLSVFAFADVSSLVQLGYLIGPNIPTRVFERDRSTGSWSWTDSGDPLEFSITPPSDFDGRPLEIVMVANVSGSVDVTSLPDEIKSMPRWTISPREVNGRLSIIQHSIDVERFASTLKSVLGHLESVCATPLIVHLLGPMPIPVAITAGVVLRSRTVNELVLYDFDGTAYKESVRELAEDQELISR